MNVKINYIPQISLYPRNYVPLFKTTNNYNEVLKFSGHNMMKNSDLGIWNKFLFRGIDLFSRIFKNNPKIISKIINWSTKMVKKSGSLSEQNVVL